MEKINKKVFIKKLVTDPQLDKKDKNLRSFWSREMKILNYLLDKFPNITFWQKVRLQKVNSLLFYKTEKGLKKLIKKYKEFNYKIPQKKDIILSDKAGEDFVVNKKNKTLRQFLDE